MNTSHGLPTQAVFGFIRMLLKLLKDARPSHIAIVFDSPSGLFATPVRRLQGESQRGAQRSHRADSVYSIGAVAAFRIKSLDDRRLRS